MSKPALPTGGFVWREAVGAITNRSVGMDFRVLKRPGGQSFNAVGIPTFQDPAASSFVGP